MRRLFPAFLQRRWLVAAARRALQAGRPGSALEILRDELLAQDPRAAELRALVLPLVPAPPPPPPREAQSRGQLGELLAEMRAKREQGTRAAAGSARAAHGPPDALVAGPEGRAASPVGAPVVGSGNAPAERASPSPGDAALRARPLRLRMSLDDAGTFLVCAGTTASVGHSRAGEADVPILADLLPRHARFVLEPASFHGGPVWRVEPLGGGRARIVATPGDAHAAGEELAPAGRRLSGGERLRLSEHTELVFAMPDRAGSSAVLELSGSLEAAGARRVLLFAPGAEGRVTVGANSARHVPVNLSGVELELEFEPAAPGAPGAMGAQGATGAPGAPGAPGAMGAPCAPGDGARGARLVVRCASGFFLDASPAGAPLTEHALALPLARAEHLRLVMPSAAARPRWLSFSPLEDA